MSSNCCFADFGCGFCCVVDCCVGDFCTNCGDCCVGNCGDCSDCRDCGNYGNCNDRSDSEYYRQTNRPIIIANEIAEMVDRADVDARNQENEIINDINEKMDEFINWIKEINQQDYGGTTLNINIHKIEELNEDLRRKVVGTLGTKLKSRLIQTDPELSTILSEPDDRKRKRNFDDFYNERFRDALRELIDIIDTSVREQSESIEREIQNRMNEINESMNAEMAAFEELEKLKLQEDSRLAEKRVEYMYYENLCAVTFGQLSSGAK